MSNGYSFSQIRGSYNENIHILTHIYVRYADKHNENVCDVGSIRCLLYVFHMYTTSYRAISVSFYTGATTERKNRNCHNNSVQMPTVLRNKNKMISL